MQSADTPTITTSERSCFRRCPRKWYWAYRCGLRRTEDTPDALWFGIGVHHALAEWYGEGAERGPHPAKTFKTWVGDEIRHIKASRSDRDREWYDEPLYIEAGELGTAMLTAYVDHYYTDPDWNVIAVEQSFEIDIVDEHGDIIGTFMSTFDGVEIDQSDGGVYLIEHKTASQISTAYLELDDQAGIYFAVADICLHEQGILERGEHIQGIQYNFLRKSKPDPRPRNRAGAYLNQDGRVSKRQPPPPFVRPEPLERSPREVQAQLARLRDEIKWMNAIREGRAPVIKNTTYECPRCPFFDMCVLHERGGSAWKDLRDSVYRVVDPYDRYRKSASE